MKKLITVDIDDVVADSTEAFRVAVNNHVGANLTREDYNVPHTGYDGYYEHVWKSHGLNIVYEELSLPMQLDQSHIGLVKGAKETLLKLSQRYRIAFLTSRPVSWEDATHLYIAANLKNLDADVYFINLKEGIGKGKICQELGASWHIDDNPDHCQSVLQRGVKAVLFGNYGWHYKPVPEAVICKDWKSVLEYFDGQG